MVYMYIPEYTYLYPFGITTKLISINYLILQDICDKYQMSKNIIL